MKKGWVLALIIIVITACAPQDQVPGPEATDTQVNKDQVPESEAIVTKEIGDFDYLTKEECQPLQFEVEAISPIGKMLDPSPPHTFTWDIDCIPNVYKLTLYKYNKDNETQIMIEILQKSAISRKT